MSDALFRETIQQLQNDREQLRAALRRLEQIVIDAGIFPHRDDLREAGDALRQARQALLSTGGYDAQRP